MSLDSGVITKMLTDKQLARIFKANHKRRFNVIVDEIVDNTKLLTDEALVYILRAGEGQRDFLKAIIDLFKLSKSKTADLQFRIDKIDAAVKKLKKYRRTKY